MTPAGQLEAEPPRTARRARRSRRRLAPGARRPARGAPRPERPVGARGRGRRHAPRPAQARRRSRPSPRRRSPPRRPGSRQRRSTAPTRGAGRGRRTAPRHPARPERQGAAHRRLVRLAGARLGAVRRRRPRGRGRPGRRADRGDEALQRDQVRPRRAGRPGHPGERRPGQGEAAADRGGTPVNDATAAPPRAPRPCHRLGALRADQVLTNADLEKIVDTSDEWIRTRTGIRERRVAAANETTASMGAVAGLRAIQTAGHPARRHRPDPPRHADARLLDAVDGGARQGGDRQHEGHRVRRHGGLLRVRLRLRDRPGLHPGRPREARPRHRRRSCSRGSSTTPTGAPASCSATARARSSSRRPTSPAARSASR